jgi:uncharacterized protein with HEPN domain
MNDPSADGLLDILELITRIERHIGKRTREEFLADLDIQDATAYKILAIGEGSRNLDAALKLRHSVAAI